MSGMVRVDGLTELMRQIGSIPDELRGEGFEKEHAAVFAAPEKTNAQLKMFTIICGKTDFVYQSAVALHQTLEKGGIKHNFVETDGGHIWPNWRRYLRDFAPVLFR